MPPSKISYLTDVHFGFDAVRVLRGVLEQLSVRRPMVVTDAPLARAGIVERLGLGAPVVFDKVQTNPTEASAVEGVAVFRQHACDGIVAVGGGSPMDLGKAVALLVHHAPPLEQYAMVRDGTARITSKKPPVVAVPTTAGTGSEAGRAALITLLSDEKLAIVSPHLIPDAAVCDPMLTLGMPAGLTAATGVDAISHCVETFLSPLENPVADAIALDGLERAVTHVRRVVQEPSNREARKQMMMAALQGGLTFQKGLGAIHALSHPMGAMPGKTLHHGTLNAIFLPHVLRFNHDASLASMGSMADRLGLGSSHQLPDVFARLAEEIGLPTRLSELGVEAKDLDALVPQALQDHCCATNPRPITAEDCRMLYEAAL